MAHASTGRKRRGAPRWAAALAIVATTPALAIGLGELEVTSSLGEILDASVAIAPREGESVASECFALGRGRAGAIPYVTRATLALEGESGSRRLRIRSAVPLNEPAVTLRVNAACTRDGARVTRDYIVLLDPRPATAGVSPNSVPGTAFAPESRPDDTLKSIATAIFPLQRGARRVYIEALREENPSLAALRDEEPIPVGSPLRLPDLRTFAKGRPLGDAPRPPVTAALAPAPAPSVPKPVGAARPAKSPPVVPKSPDPIASKAVGRATGGAFLLKLSAPEVDLARTRGVSEPMRKQLRERQLILDADDQLSALLSLRNSVKVLENKVADLQLKLSTVASFPPEAAKAQAPPTPKVEPVAAPKAELPAVAKSEPPGPPKPEPTPSRIEEAAPKSEPHEARVEVPAPGPELAPVKKTPAVSVPASKPVASDDAALPDWIWGVVALLALVIAWIGFLIVRRRAAPRPYVPEEPVLAPSIAGNQRFESPPALDDDMPVAARAGAPAEHRIGQRRTVDSDASLTTSVSAGDPSDLRRRYIEERFPEIVARTIELEEPDSIVKGARLFYEDGALPRAVELLQFAIEEKPDELKRWLALFEIFRLERLTGEFAELASRFRDYHGMSAYWTKVQHFGREIDPSNPLYQEESFNDIETIGMPAAAKKMQALAFDPLAENWLNAPMDFSSEVLATQLRAKLMASAGISEAELIPKPMSALKNVEMFTVA